MKYKILYVEDEIRTRKSVSAFIKNNYDVVMFESDDGKDGFESYLANKPDILITDLFMGNNGGFELIEKIREIDAKIKIIIFSAYSEQEKLLKAIKLNLEDYIIKPISRKKLRDSIDNILTVLDNNKMKMKIYFNNNSFFILGQNLLFLNNLNVKITKMETKLLYLFIDNNNQVLNSMDIYNNIWDFEKEYKVESIRTLIKKLRKKLPENTITNIYGGGYIISLQL